MKAATAAVVMEAARYVVARAGVVMVGRGCWRWRVEEARTMGWWRRWREGLLSE